MAVVSESVVEVEPCSLFVPPCRVRCDNLRPRPDSCQSGAGGCNMDDPRGLGWAGWIVVGAIVGVLIGWERATRGRRIERQTIGINIILATIWAASSEERRVGQGGVRAC